MKFSLFIFLFLNTVFCYSQEAVFSIKEPLKKFPTTQEGSIIEHTFEYENKGKSPLIITDYSVGCKCTQVIYSKEPILPGQKGTVKIIFDTNGKYLHQDRTVYLMVNTKKKIVKLRFKVFVEPKK
jgi:hypothetical protein